MKKIFIYEKNKYIYFNDLGLVYKTCINKDMFCLFSNKLNFALDKTKNIDNLRRWSTSSFDFVVVNSIRSRSGEKIYLIKVKNKLNSKREPNVIFFSKDRGIVGFIIYYLNHNITDTYWLVGDLGIGHKNQNESSPD